ncbi:asparagine synthase (glutamine-hydrolyzing) [Lujinxingia vulgaris]|uniref:asparagine synthase (glutamine-hydrolyzing) n=1 Tax=Lujinxingia vulgaris TaxID=2600176 RepID=A0A5C6XBM8_9DELT|nr:asparagine synthase (glutamine-hydrolyzing) [Lujinxingia vulgaris]TXD34769.1 asparagine synthase (glutamine-hydrolyzing) [Lujinxingia vulgaris]
MCGIAGYLSLKPLPSEDLRSRIEAMSATLRHRGPDSGDLWCEERANLALGHRRLAILDLSEGGRQPMHSACGRYVLTYNGEIYNFAELRAELEARGDNFKSDSDTEVLVALLARYGVKDALQRINGMFAFALWDRQERALWLARDRVGQKPLYYGRHGQSFLFGSELKALRAAPEFKATIDRQSLASLMRVRNVPAPHAIYENTFKLPPGCFLKVDGRTLEAGDPQPYWSAIDVFEEGQRSPFQGSASEAADLLEAHIKDAVAACMVSDVPVGAFLSGGIDSSTIVALMQTISTQPVRTFSIGFSQRSHNEAEYAKKVAEHLGCQHTELYLDDAQALDVIADLPRIYDEPFADSSQIPTVIVSELARRHVTVSLSGDGGDELFGGYHRYALFETFANTRRATPSPLFNATGRLLQSLPGAPIDILLRRVSPKLGARRPGERIVKLGEWIAQSGTEAEAYRRLMDLWPDALNPTLGAHPHPRAPWPEHARMKPRRRAMLDDTLCYLPDDILTKVDRAAMAHSLETRIPLLDHRVIAFAATLPLNLSSGSGGGPGKALLREVLSRHVPRELFERPKQGFAIPLHEWLRTGLRAWADDLLSEDRLRRQGFFAPQTLAQRWRDHRAGLRDESARLWPALMFQSWLADTHSER